MSFDKGTRGKAFLSRIEKRRNAGTAVFLICYIAAFLVFLPLIIKGNGILTLSLDFNAQELPFNVFANREIKAGNIFFNWAIDIGSDFIASFSFYNIGSPFFWITLPFRPEAFPYLAGFLYPLKYAVAGLTAYLWISRYCKNNVIAAMGGILYSFSGFQATNLVFYHFHDATALFPLLLLGLDELVQNRKWKLFVLSVFLNASVNWVFFVGEALFLVIYYCVRYGMIGRILRKEGSIVIREVLRCLFFALIGGAAAAFILLPSVTSMLGADRLGNHLAFGRWWTYSLKEYLYLIRGLLFPSDPMYRMSAFYENNWYSVSAYLPMVGIVPTVSFLVLEKNGRNAWLKRLLLILGIMAAVPILNSAYSAFNAEPYRRWFYIPVLMMALASAMVIERIYLDAQVRTKVLHTVRIMVCVMLLFAVLTVILSKWQILDIHVYLPVSWLAYCMIGIGGAVLFGWLTRSLYHNGRCLWALLACILLFGLCNQFIDLFKYNKWADWPHSDMVISNVFNTSKVEDADVLPYRWEMLVFDGYYNCNLANSLTSRNSFISTVDNGISEFYDALGTGRHTLTLQGPQGTGELLSARFLIEEASEPVPAGYERSGTLWNGDRSIGLYENTRIPPIGFTYDSYLTRSEFDAVEKEQRALIMLQTLVVSDEDAKTVSSVLKHFETGSESSDLSKETEQILDERRKESSGSFEHDTKGFRSVIHASSDKYAFFSVPYSTRWKASVNGQPVRILNINGLMAVPVSVGDNSIDFRYDITLHLFSACLSIVTILFLTGVTIRDSLHARNMRRKSGFGK